MALEVNTCCLFQNTMLQSIERYMKQAIVDKCYAVSSAALASSLVSRSCQVRGP